MDGPLDKHLNVSRTAIHKRRTRSALPVLRKVYTKICFVKRPWRIFEVGLLIFLERIGVVALFSMSFYLNER
jgi:hypothetical protein